MSTSPTDFAAGIYQILNLATGEYVLRGNAPGEGLRTGPQGFGTAVFRVLQVGDNAQLFIELDTGLKPVPSASSCPASDLQSVVWERYDTPWVFRATGPGQLNFGRIPEEPNTFWANVEHKILLKPIGPFSDYRLVLANDAE